MIIRALMLAPRVVLLGSGATCLCGLPAEVYALLSVLSGAVLGVAMGLIADHLHPFAVAALLVAVFANHVQLTDSVLREQERGTDIQGDAEPKAQAQSRRA